MKVVYSDKKTGKTSQVEVPKEAEPMFIGKKIGEVIEGSLVGMEGYKMIITGLSDKMGVPSRRDTEGSRKAYVLMSSGPGIIGAKRGKRMRKLIRGNMVSVDTGQINSAITEYGTKSADEIFPKKEKPAAEATEEKK
jgi:small subunit ribosomal protein S6e